VYLITPALVSRDEIRDNEYNLNIPRYVDSGEAAENWDIYATMFGGIPIKEIDELSVYWEAFPGLKESLFTNTTDEIAAIKIDELTPAINTHTDVKAFVASFAHAFANFDTTLKSRLIEQMLTLSIAKEKSILSADIFSRLQPIALIDRYAAYQLLDDAWQAIAGDLEILQTEGFEAAKQVDPNMMMKKVKGKDTEVQDGWKGHIFPFELVQKVYLPDELQSLLDKEIRLAEITAQYDELLEALSEEAKDSSITNESKDAFVNAEIVKAAKEIASDKKKGIKYGEDDDETKIWKVNSLIAEEKTIKKEFNEEAYALHILTKKTIETLTDKQVNDLLERKWISPLVNALHSLPGNSIATLIQKVNYLAAKYSTTLQQISNKLKDTELALAKMMGELDGSAHDMQALNEWQKLLKGDDDGSN
jgi:type I restriction enzyme M protein